MRALHTAGHEVLTVDTAREHIVFTPFTRPEWELVFDAATDSVTVRTLDGEPVEILAPARTSFKGMLRNTDWDTAHLGYSLGYACWNYFTSPFLFTFPGVRAREIEPWHEAGQTWRRLAVRFPPEIATHSPDAVFYYDAIGMQRRMDDVAEINAPHGFMHFFRSDVCALTAGSPSLWKATQYLMGNQILAERAFREDASAALHAPLPALIYAYPDGDTKFAVDQPGPLFDSYGDARIAEVGREFDALLAQLIKLLGGEAPPQL